MKHKRRGTTGFSIVLLENVPPRKARYRQSRFTDILTKHFNVHQSDHDRFNQQNPSLRKIHLKVARTAFIPPGQ